MPNTSAASTWDVAATAGVAASAQGPLRFSLGFDLSGNYMPVLVLACAVVSDRRCTLRATSKTVRI